MEEEEEQQNELFVPAVKRNRGRKLPKWRGREKFPSSSLPFTMSLARDPDRRGDRLM